MTGAAGSAVILVVDDEEPLRRHVARHLEKAGYVCLKAADVPEARRALADNSVDVVLCDVNMPGENGLDLLAHLRDNYPDTMTVMVSGLDDTETAQSALTLGAVGYVLKPFERNELLINVANALHRRTLAIENRMHREQLEELVEMQANFDLLTGLANRQHLAHALQRMLDVPSAPETRPAVLLLDLDHFKVINDSLGHEAGDLVLKEVSRRMAPLLGPADMAARFGSDTFVFLIDRSPTNGSHPDEQQIVERAIEILAALEPPHVVEGRELHAAASVGIVPDTSAYLSSDTVLRDADAAMNQAKAAGRGTYRIVDEVVRARARKRLDIETGLREALDKEQLTVHYQPQYNLATGALVGFEALLRWRHPEVGLVLPDEFIPIAEETGLIVPIGRWVLEQACVDLADFRRESGRYDLSMAVNVSGQQLLRAKITDDIDHALEVSGVEGAGLCIEITESVLLEDVVTVRKILGALKGLGIRISIDDFGTGYSSLGYIGKLPIDELKIDRVFIVDLDDARGAALVRGIISLARALGHVVVAEGIETRSQYDEMRRAECDLAQGFLLSRPIAKSAVFDLLHVDAGATAEAGDVIVD